MAGIIDQQVVVFGEGRAHLIKSQNDLIPSRVEEQGHVKTVAIAQRRCHSLRIMNRGLEFRKILIGIVANDQRMIAAEARQVGGCKAGRGGTPRAGIPDRERRISSAVAGINSFKDYDVVPSSETYGMLETALWIEGRWRAINKQFRGPSAVCHDAGETQLGICHHQATRLL